MKQKSMNTRDGAEQTVRDIRRKTPKQYSAEKKTRIGTGRVSVRAVE